MWLNRKPNASIKNRRLYQCIHTHHFCQKKKKKKAKIKAMKTKKSLSSAQRIFDKK